jgi:hypothetical protein
MDAVRLAQLLRQMPEDTATQPFELGNFAAPARDNTGFDESGYVAKYGVPAPYNSLKDYQQATGRHLNDEFKLPNHPTFSNGSVYSRPDIQGGAWQKGGANPENDVNWWNFQPSEVNMQNMSSKDLSDYFTNREGKNTFITLPNGQLVEGSK